MDATVGHTDLTEPVHRDVTLYLYGENGSVITSKCLGTVNESTDVPITMNARQTPKYIIINSQDFWRFDTISVNYYELTQSSRQPDGIYSEHTVGSKEEFPVTVPPNSRSSVTC